MRPIKLPAGVYHYDETKPLGQPGGFGQVFAGKTSSGKEIAVKKLHLRAADAAHRELRIAEELKGRAFQHVIFFINSGEDADTGEYFVLMPKAEVSLQSFVEINGKRNAAQASEILLHIANGLKEVSGLVHRDLKPDNVLLHEGSWKVADFGIAKFVAEATASNTLKNYLSEQYAAPEQWRNETATHATDIYALGCIGYFLLVGSPPFTSNFAQQHQHSPVPSFGCDNPTLQALISMMLRKLPDTRPSLDRVVKQLSQMKSAQPKRATSEPSSLAHAGAHIADEIQRLQAQQQAAEAERKARNALAKDAREILMGNIRRLFERISIEAPAARCVEDNAGFDFGCDLGYGRMEVRISGSASAIAAGAFKHSGWDVITWARIIVGQHRFEGESNTWASTLWYAKLKGSSDFRWYEVSYWNVDEPQLQLSATVQFNDADLAASNLGHSLNIAFGPEAIDDEGEDKFHERWTDLLAKAAEASLYRPSSLPITGWPPQHL